MMSSNLPQGWEEKELVSLSSLISSGGTPSRKNKHYYENGTNFWLKTKELYDKNIYLTEEQITDEAIKKSSAKLYPINTIVIAMYGATVGQLGIMKNEMATNQACCCIVTNKEKLNYKYLFYYLLNNRNKIISLANGAAQQNLNSQQIKNYYIHFPQDINEQKRIADNLSAFDDKIELNNQMNQTLEDMATALFMDSISNKNGFNETTLGDLVNIKYGKDHKHLDDGTMPLYGSGGIMRYVDNFLYDKESILIPRKGTLGNLFFIQKPFWTVDTLFYTEINIEKVIPIYLYYLLKRLNLANLNVGSAVPSLTKQALNALELEIPNITIQKKISDILSSYHNKILDNIEQNQTLKKQRDTLLPKLMSGEIRV